MASNRLPSSRSGLKTRCLFMQAGCEEIQDSVGLMHATASVLSGACSDFENKETEALAARAERAQAYQAAQALDEQASALLAKVSRALRNVLSNRYSAKWAESGWPGNSVSVPSTQDLRFTLLRQLSVFFGKHADYQTPSQGVTGAACEALYNQLLAARNVVPGKESNAEVKQNALEAAEKTLRTKMQDLISELSRLLSGSDPRWLRFGLNLPDAPEVPDVPENVRVNTDIPGKLLVACDPAAGAAYYRFWTQAANAINAEPVAAGTAQEPQFLIEGLAPGAAVRVFVSAVNAEGGESRRSEAIEVIPTAVAA